MTAGKVNPVAREILRHNVRAIADDMSVALEHNSSSETVSEARDYAVAFTTMAGEVVVAENPVHVPSLAMTAQAILDYYEFNLKPGDLVVTNDPYSGGTHTQDLTLFAPVYAREELIGCLLVRVHAPDFGGQIVGGYNPPALELWAEGVRFNPVKLARFGRTDKDIHRMVLLNSRMPEQVDRLLDAVLSSLALGQERVQQMIARYGLETFLDGIEYTLGYSEAAARSIISGWPRGEFPGQAVMAHDCAGRSAMVRCRIRAEDGSLRVDFSGSDPQSASFANSSWGWTCGSALLPIVSCLGPDFPVNSGLLRAVRFEAEEGSLVRPVYPAAIGWGQMHPGTEIINAVSDALAGCTGIALPALPPHAVVSCCFAGYRILSVDGLAYPGSGAMPEQDGWGPPSYFSRRRLPSIEKTEIAFPEALIERVELTADGDGASRRSGPGCEVAVRLRAAAAITACVERPPNATAPRLSITTDATEIEIETFCADRRIPAGALHLLTASGPAGRELSGTESRTGASNAGEPKMAAKNAQNAKIEMGF